MVGFVAEFFRFVQVDFGIVAELHEIFELGARELFEHVHGVGVAVVHHPRCDDAHPLQRAAGVARLDLAERVRDFAIELGER